MEDSPIGLDKWLPAIWLICSNRNGISSWELHRALGVTQKTAWFMLQRIRLAMQDEAHGGKLGGYGVPVEVDETFIGGKERRETCTRIARRAFKKDGRNEGGKTVVLGILERRGKVRAKVISDRKASIIRPFVKENIAGGSEVHSDEHGETWAIDSDYTHEMINHAEKYR